MNNLLLYVHFNRENRLNPHVVYQLEHLRRIFSEVFFITNSELSEADKAILGEKKLFDHFLQRKNEGYDFAAWSEAMQQIGFEALTAYDSVTIMNDTCFGPILDFQPIFSTMTAKDNDFWGLTNNRAHEVNLPERSPIMLPDHIQSYFISFKKSLLSSQSFQSFWSQIEVLENVSEVILKYESQMTSYFEKAGFRSDVLFDTRKADLKEMLGEDFSQFNLSAMLEHKLPFLKVKAFAIAASNSTLPAIVEYIKQISDYPTSYIVNYMTWFDSPDRPYMLNDKMIQIKRPSLLNTGQAMPSVGIHLHVYYKDLLLHFIELFDSYVAQYDLYITTDTEESKATIEKMLADKTALKEILVVGKIGRDVLPWMKVHDRLSQYDIAGHFHTKKSLENLWIVGESWRADIERQLIKPAQQIFAEFEKNPQLGIIIPEVPTYYQSNFGPLLMDENEMWQNMAEMWEKTDFRVRKPYAKKDFYVMSYGTMVWYRPQALDNLLSIDIEAEIPAEPLPKNSILHAFERLLIYVAWGNDYDFRIAHDTNFNGFWGNNAANLAIRQMQQDGEDDRLWKFLFRETADEKIRDALLTADESLWKILRLRDILSLLSAKIKYIIKLKLHRK